MNMKYSFFTLSFLLFAISCDNSTGPDIEPLVVQVAEDVIADPAVIGPDGQPMTYSLDHKEGGRRLREDETLYSARVVEGDHLIVYPEIVAG